MSKTNKCFKLGFNKDQGIGFTEVSGSDWIFPEQGIKSLRLIDGHNNPRHIALDSKKGIFYDIGTYTGPSGTKLFKNRVNISGTGGTDITPVVKFREDKGDLERFFLRTKTQHIYTRPQVEADGYVSGIQFDLEMFVDGSSTAGITCSDVVLPKHEIVLDREKEGNRVQLKLTANKSQHKIVGRTSNYIAYDKRTVPTSHATTEDTYQTSLNSNQVFWLSRGGSFLVDKVTGTTKVGAGTVLTGPDSRVHSALTITTPIQLANSAFTGTLMLWHKSGYTISGVTLTQHGVVGSWILSYCNGSIPANLILPVGDVADVRGYSATIDTNTRTYLYDDMNKDSGDNTMNIG